MREPERLLGQMASAMRDGNLANMVIFALAKAAEELTLTDEDMIALHDASEFLDKVKEGFYWSDNPVIKEDSITSAFSFETAASSWKSDSSAPTNFIKYVDEMASVVNEVHGGGMPDKEVLNLTRAFFGKVLKYSVDRCGPQLPAQDVLDSI